MVNIDYALETQSKKVTKVWNNFYKFKDRRHVSDRKTRLKRRHAEVGCATDADTNACLFYCPLSYLFWIASFKLDLNEGSKTID